MCGLVGEMRFDGLRADVGAVERAAACLARRGPDDSGVWARGPVALAHRRLEIIDLSAAGAQPMIDAALGLTVVFNGCIYNYRELRAELEGAGYHFFSTPTPRSSSRPMPGGTPLAWSGSRGCSRSPSWSATRGG